MPKKNYSIDQIIHHISYHPKERLDHFRELNPTEKRDVILGLSKYLQNDIISKLSKKELLNVLEHLDTDEATDILQLLPAKKRKATMEKLSHKLKEDVSVLLQFDPETAAGLMNVNYIQVEAEDTIASVFKQVKIHESRTGKPPAILVMKTGKLIGCLPGYRLGIGKEKDKAEKHTVKIKSIKYKAKSDEIFDLFRQHPHNKIVVLGETNNVIGIIYSDDILKFLREKEASSLYDFAGVNQEESVYDSTKNKIKRRYKWLIINLGTAFLAAFTVGLFDEVISKYVLLAIYMPIVAGMGGNAGTQTLAVLVRGISLGQIKLKTMWRTLKNELGSGFVNGIINGLIISLVVYIKDGDLRIGLILALAMIINLLIAAFFGTVVPLIMKRLGKDPASSATVFITTATDVFGFIAFLGLATLIL